jgi:hypothetical protein
LVEHHDGKLELIDWVARNKLSLLTRPAGRISASKTAVMQAFAHEIAASARDAEPASALSTGV